jgi:preprotein translocase subunit SecY
VLILTTGTMLLMWLGEQITERGIGNGISLVITIGILAACRRRSGRSRTCSSPARLEPVQLRPRHRAAAAAGGVIAGVIAVTQAQRKIPVQYAQRAVGRKGLRRRHLVHAAARQLRGRHADHLRPGHPDVPAEDFPFLGAW